MAAVFKVGQGIQVVAPPHRKGVVRAVIGTGTNAVIVCNLIGWHVTSFTPGQIVPL